MLKNTKSQYGLVARFFHWSMSPMMIGMLILGFVMTSLERSDFKFELYYWHKATGVFVLLLAFLRLLWRFMNTSLELPSSLPAWQKIASKITHFLLYASMFFMPCSGILMASLSGRDINVFNLFIIPAFFEKNLELASLCSDLHTVCAFTLCGLISLHIFAALYHHFVLKDNLLTRIIR